MEIFYINSELFIDDLSPKISKRKLQHLLGRFLLCFVAQNHYEIDNTKIILRNEKPVFIDNNLHFSITHSKNIVAVVFDDFPVGLDVEYLKIRNYKSILETFNVNLESANAMDFYGFWTQYEAKFKLQEASKSICTLRLLPDFMLSIASGQFSDIKSKLKIYEVKSPKNSINPNELTNLKLVIDSKKNENMLVVQDINTASLEFFTPLNLNMA